MDDKEYFIKQYYEQVMFNELKDRPFDTLNYIRRKYPDYDTKYNVDYSMVYKKIMDYRIKRYGTSFMPTSTYKKRKVDIIRG